MLVSVYAFHMFTSRYELCFCLLFYTPSMLTLIRKNTRCWWRKSSARLSWSKGYYHVDLQRYYVHNLMLTRICSSFLNNAVFLKRSWAVHSRYYCKLLSRPQRASPTSTSISPYITCPLSLLCNHIYLSELYIYISDASPEKFSHTNKAFTQIYNILYSVYQIHTHTQKQTTI